MNRYGITWWGKQWLNSLASIDYGNRLPRGRSYAGKGAVNDISFKKNRISAKVAGSRPKPYKVEIDIPLFSEKVINKLCEIINNNPQLISKLLNRELSPELDALARTEGISLFPSSWKDFGMNCSCPDWAVPCKHLAAVLYIVANEIDKNPFIVFDLHGFNILEAFSDGGKNNISLEIPEFKTLLTLTPRLNSPAPDKTEVANIDISVLAGLAFDPVALLPASPVFYSRDFRDLLAKAMSSTARFLKNHEPDREQFFKPDPDSSVSFVVTNDFSIFAAEIKTEGKTIQISVNKLLDILRGIEDNELAYLDYSWVFVHKLYFFTLQLIANSLYFPRLWQNAEGNFILRYLPAIFSEEVKTISDKLIACQNQDILKVLGTSKDKPLLFVKRDDDQLGLVCSIFIGHFLNETHDSGSLHSAWRDADDADLIVNLFITGQGSGFDTFETAGLPASVYQWLSIYDIHFREFIPVLKVEEHPSGFSISILLSQQGKENESPVELSAIFSLKKFDKVRLQILKDLSIAGNYMPLINNIIARKGKQPEILTASAFSGILTDMLPVVRSLGVKIILPKSLRQLVYPGLSLRIKMKAGSVISVSSLLGLSDLVDYSWEIALGENHVDAAEFLKMVRGMSGLVKLRDQYLFLDEKMMKSLQKNLDRDVELSSNHIIHASLAGEIQGLKAGLSEDLAALVKDIMRHEAPTVPEGLNATLRPYQVRGYEWLAQNFELGMGSIIADDMGLGKTIQVITLLLHLKRQGNLMTGKALVVVPTTLISNWMNEIARFGPSLSAYAYHGSGRREEFATYDIIVTSYGMVRNSLSMFEKQKWLILIADEAQNIKNHTTEQTKAIRKIQAGYRIAMSGTPVENRLTEYWSIFDFANRGYLGSFKWFSEEYAKPIHFSRDASKIETFRRITAPFLLRRLKSDKTIIADLPDKVERNLITFLVPEQSALYQNIVDQSLEKIKTMDGIERRGLVFKLMMALKQTCNHPYQYLKTGKKDINCSGKAKLLMELLSGIVESDGKVLIFTQFREMGELICEFVTSLGYGKPLFLHGGTTRNQRDEMVNKFQNSHYQIFILSLKAGGTGLNLTAANHVIHYDLWWNPAVEAQATDRAYRIGQKNNVQVYRLINQGTIEEKIDLMIQEKKSIADLTLTEGETWIGNLSNEELKELIRLG
jgi:uncharacterized Zn finger protein/superfamily II DNA or RNA helicase